MPYLKTKSYAVPSVFTGILAISDKPFMDLGGTVSQVFYQGALILQPGDLISNYGLSGGQPFALAPAEQQRNAQAVAGLGRGYWTHQSGGIDLNVAGPANIDWTAVEIDEGIYDDTDPFTKVLNLAGRYSIQMSLQVVQAGAGLITTAVSTVHQGVGVAEGLKLVPTFFAGEVRNFDVDVEIQAGFPLETLLFSGAAFGAPGVANLFTIANQGMLRVTYLGA